MTHSDYRRAFAAIASTGLTVDEIVTNIREYRRSRIAEDEKQILGIKTREVLDATTLPFRVYDGKTLIAACISKDDACSVIEGRCEEGMSPYRIDHEGETIPRFGR